ncbi:MAG: hypothetical protein WAV90_00465 [Gordonia amarae]
MDSEMRAWLEPMVAELLSRPDPIAVLTAVDTAGLTPAALVAVSRVGSGELGSDVDWLGIGMLVRSALGWEDYPPVPGSAG